MLTRRVFSAAGVTAALAGFDGVGAAPGERLLLGQSAALSGPAAQLGLPFMRGAQACFDSVNAQGGVARRYLELRSYDDGYEPARCLANTRRLLAEGCFALFGYVGTPTSLAALPLVEAAGLPFFAPVTGARALRLPLRRQVFHVRASYADEIELIVRQLISQGIKKVAALLQDDAFGQAGLDELQRALARLGLQPTAQARVPRHSVEVTQALKTLLAATPEAVLLFCAYRSAAAFIRAARSAGFGGGLYNVSFVGAQALADALGTEAHGVVVSQVVPSPQDSSLPLVRECTDALRRAGSLAVVNHSSLEGYLAARVLVEGLRRAGARSLSHTRLVAALESLQNQHFGGFALSFSTTSHEGSRYVDLSVLGAGVEHP